MCFNLAGDSLVVWRLDRLGRSVKDILIIADDLHGRGIGLRITDDPAPAQQALLTKVTEFRGYIHTNAAQIPNYGERHRCGEAISSATAESAVNQVISRRMVKKQQMRWTPAGAHLLLQIRTRVLNNDLATDFHRWYPGYTRPAKIITDAA